jgi:hypothetical protein
VFHMPTLVELSAASVFSSLHQLKACNLSDMYTDWHH